MNKIILKPYQPVHRQMFIEMLSDYFNNDLNEKMPPDRVSLIAARIEYELGIFDMWLYILYSCVNPVGFIWLQKDTPENPWCVKPDWGFIREMYIRPPLRRQGLGAAAVSETINIIKKSGVNRIYLTAESKQAHNFWQRAGFRNSGEICEKNGGNVFVL